VVASPREFGCYVVFADGRIRHLRYGRTLRHVAAPFNFVLAPIVAAA
jgi:hypothetical protein